MTDERLKIWLGFWRWLVVTAGISWATVMINAKYKSTELEIKINQEEKKYLTSFLEKALDNNLEKRRRFAQYFACVTTSEKYKRGWNNYLKAINQEINNVEKEKNKLLQEIPDKSGEELERAREKIERLESELLRSPQQKSPCEIIQDSLDKTLLTSAINKPGNDMTILRNTQGVNYYIIPNGTRGGCIEYQIQKEGSSALCFYKECTGGSQLQAGQPAKSGPKMSKTVQVRPSDSLSIIAEKYGVSVSDIVSANKRKYPSLAKNPYRLEVGWDLKIPRQQ